MMAGGSLVIEMKCCGMFNPILYRQRKHHLVKKYFERELARYICLNAKHFTHPVTNILTDYHHDENNNI